MSSLTDFYGGMVTNIIDTEKQASFKVSPYTDDKVLNVKTCFKTDFEPLRPLSPQVMNLILTTTLTTE